MSVNHGVVQRAKGHRVTTTQPCETRQPIDRWWLLDPAEWFTRRDRGVPFAYCTDGTPCIRMHDDLAHVGIGENHNIRVQLADGVDAGLAESVLPTWCNHLPAKPSEYLGHIGAAGRDCQSVRTARV